MRILTVIGARPQFVKAAVVSGGIRNWNEENKLRNEEIHEVIVHTGQHYDHNMSNSFFEELDIPEPKYNLGIGGGHHGEMTGKQIIAIEKVILDEKPDFVLVYGDTNSTLAAAIAAVKIKVPVVHVEAGLRSFNRAMPEEINRVLTDHVSSVLFCPTEVSVNNLSYEGIVNSKERVVSCVGDVMQDAVISGLKKVSYHEHGRKVPRKDFILVTLHRAELIDSNDCLNEIICSLNVLSEDYEIVFPVHPRTKKRLNELDIELKFELVEPVGYLEMLFLIKQSLLVVTDSGGLQKEAYMVGRFCITVRKETEWTELVACGANYLVGYSGESLLSTFKEISNLQFESTVIKRDMYGNGRAVSNIIEALMEYRATND